MFNTLLYFGGEGGEFLDELENLKNPKSGLKAEKLCYVISPLIFYKDVSALFMLSELQPYAQG